jgi:hypothetical protein
MFKSLFFILEGKGIKGQPVRHFAGPEEALH